LSPSCKGSVAPREATDVAAFVLAGGASVRMGSDKALASFAGRTLIEHALAILRRAGFSPSIAGARSDLSRFAHVVPDPALGLGPLAGICAALGSTSASLAVVLTLDLPLVPPSLISCLLWQAAVSGAVVTLASSAGFPQTFPAVIDRSSLPVLAGELKAGRSGCFSAFQAAALALSRPLRILPAEVLAQCGHASHAHGLPAAFWFLNANTPADLARAEIAVSCQFAYSGVERDGRRTWKSGV